VTIWRSDFRIVAEVVRVGSVLTVVGRRGEWLEVVLPFGAGIAGVETGFIHQGNVEVATGTLPGIPELRTQDPDASSQPSARTIGIWGFGHFGYTRFAAHDSVQAVTGQAGGGIFGGGAEVRIGRGLFVGGMIEHFSKTGERVYVLDQDVFKLGIPDDISITPITVTAGWRFVHERATPYVGGGAGTVGYKETSSFADAGENVDQRFTSYHVLGGIDFRNGWLATAFEVQYSRVPDAIGVAGASAAFAEHDLGGWATRVKIMVGK
jgi:opacity protein-like surface antigen